jgi:hypothetical protein
MRALKHKEAAVSALLGLVAGLGLCPTYARNESEWCLTYSIVDPTTNGSYQYMSCPDGSRSITLFSFDDPYHPQEYMKVWDIEGNLTYWYARWSDPIGGVRVVSEVSSTGNWYVPDDIPFDDLNSVPEGVQVLTTGFRSALERTTAP